MATYEGYVSFKLLTKKDTLKISQTFNDVIQNAEENQFLTDQNFLAESWPIKLNSYLSTYYGAHYPFYVQAPFLHKIITNNDIKINRIHYQLKDDSFTDIGDNTDTQNFKQPGCIGYPIPVITNEGHVLRVHVDNGLNLSNCAISHIIEVKSGSFTNLIFNKNNDGLKLIYDATTKTASGTYNDNGGIEVSIKELTDKPNSNWYEIKGITKSSNNTSYTISWDLCIPYIDADNSPNYLYVRFYQLSSSSFNNDYYRTVVYISNDDNTIYGPYTVYFNGKEAGTIPSGKRGEELSPSWNTIGEQNYYKQGIITIGNGVHICKYKNGDSATYTGTLSAISGLWMYASC
jgi:hypothetical protein